MNEEALQDAYTLFQSAGYSKSLDEYVKLINSNENALNDSYNLFKSNGYGKSINDFKTLLGVGQVKEPVKTEPFAKEATAPTTMFDEGFFDQAKEQPQGPGATVEEVQAPVTESKLADGSLEQPKPKAELSEELIPYRDRILSAKSEAESLYDSFYEEASSIDPVFEVQPVTSMGYFPGSAPAQKPKKRYEAFLDQAKEQIKNKKGDLSEESVIEKAKNLYAISMQEAYKKDVEKNVFTELKDQYGPNVIIEAASRAFSPMGTPSRAKFDYDSKRRQLSDYFSEESEQNKVKYEESVFELESSISDRDRYIKEYNDIVSEINKKGEASEEEMTRINNLSSLVDFKNEQINQLEETYTESLSNFEDYREIALESARSYSAFDKPMANIASAAINFVGNIAQYATDYSPLGIAETIIGEEEYNEIVEDSPGLLGDYLRMSKKSMGEIRDFALNMRDAADELQGTVRKDQELGEINSLSDFGTFMFDLASGQVFNIAVTSAMPGAGLVLLAQSAAGQKSAEMRKEEEESEGFNTYNALQKIAAPIAYGSFEYVAEKVKINKFNKVVKKMADKISLKLPNGESVTDLMQIKIPSISPAVSEALKDASQEGGTEVLTQMGQNLTDKYILGKDDVGIFDNVDEAFISGSLLNSMFQSPLLTTEVAQYINTSKKTRENLELSKQLQRDKVELEIIQQKEKDKTATTEDRRRKRALSRRMTENIETLTKNYREGADIVDKMSLSEKKDFIAANKKIQEYKNKGIKNLTKSQFEDYASAKDVKDKLLRKSAVRYGEFSMRAVVDAGDVFGAENMSFENNQELEQFVVQNVPEDVLKSFYDADGEFERSIGGALVRLKDGRLVSLYNKEAALKKKDIGKLQYAVVSHELTHAIANRMFGVRDGSGRYTAQAEVFKKIRSILPASERRALDEFLDSKRVNYNSEEEFEGELFSFLVEAMVKGKINIDAKGNLIDQVRFSLNNNFKSLVKNKYNDEVNIDLNVRTPKEVLDFFRATSKQIGEGKVDSAALDAFLDPDAKPINDFNTAQLSRESKEEELYEKLISGEIDDIQYEDAMDALDRAEREVLSKKIKKSEQKDFKSILDAAGALGKFDKDSTPFEVMDVIEDMVKVKAKRFKTDSGDIVNLENLPSFNIEDFASEVFYNMVAGKKNADGTIGDGYLKVFNPAVNDSFYGYVNAQISNRIKSVLKKGEMTQEKFTVQAEQQIDLAQDEDAFDEFDTIEQEVVLESKKIDPRKIVDEKYVSKITEEIDSKIKDLKLDDLIFKNTPNLATSTLAEVFEVREVAIQKAAQNLNSGELSRSAPVLAKMAESIIEIMPNGAIVSEGETLAISEKLIGTGTGLPRKILDAFYVKGRRLLSEEEGIGRKGAGLEPFTLKDGITKDDFLKGLGISPEGVNQVAPKTPEAQTRRAMLDLVGKLMSNTQIRQEMQNRGYSILAINNLAAGKNQAQLSVDKKKDSKKEILELTDVEATQMFLDMSKSLIDPEVLEQMNVDEIIKETAKILSATRKDANLKDINTLRKHAKKLGLGLSGDDLLDEINSIDTFKIGKPKYQSVSNVEEIRRRGVEMLAELPDPIFDYFMQRPYLMGKLLSYAGLDQSKAYVYKNNKEKKHSFDVNFSGRPEAILITNPKDKDSQFKDENGKRSFDEFSKFAKTQKQMIKDVMIARETSKKRKITEGEKKILDTIAEHEKNGEVPMSHSQTKYIFKKIIKEKGIDDGVRFAESQMTPEKNYVRRAEMLLGISASREYIYGTEDPKKRAQRFAHINRSLNYTRDGYALDSELTKDFNLISDKVNKDGYVGIQLEHLYPVFAYDLSILNSIITGQNPPVYKSSFMDSEISANIDRTYLSLNEDMSKNAKGMTISFRTSGSPQVRFEKIAVPHFNVLKGINKDNTYRQFSIIRNKNIKGPKTVEEKELKMASILEEVSGIPVEEQVSESYARIAASNRKKKFRFMSPSADDFVGLLYSFLAKGKLGESQLEFFKKTLIDPLNKATVALSHARQFISRNFKDLNKEYENVKVVLNKKSGYKNFTNDQAIRVYLYDKDGVTEKTLGLTEVDKKALINIVKNNADFKDYADYLSELINSDKAWVDPKPNWTVGSIFEDVERIIDNVKRAEFLSEWQENADAIFSENNLNKIESYFGTDFRKSLDDMLYRIKKGQAVPEKTNKEMGQFQKWLTGAVATTMFLNRRSMVLQLTSTFNFLNWTDNSPIAAAKAFANINQYAKDLARIFNSDYLRERRGGLKTEVEASVLAKELRRGASDGYRGLVNKLLQYGFTLTQIGDSLAISIGGATFYRNRKNSYLNQGMSEQQAHDQAWLDFIETSETSQQSARPDKLSMQQTNSIGRVFLAFQNTPMQYYRITTRAMQDIAAGRGNPREHVSKIAYYAFIQGVLFSSLQQAVFAFLGDAPEDEEERETFLEKKEVRLVRTINGALDTMLKGSGFSGAITATLKNAVVEFIKQEEKGYKADHLFTAIELFNLSAPVGIKLRTLYQGAYLNYKYNNEIISDMGMDIDNPAYDIAGSIVDFGLNIPVDKVINIIRGLKEAADSENEAWQRALLFAGWSTWNLGIENEKIKELKAQKTKEKRSKKKTKTNKDRGF